MWTGESTEEEYHRCLTTGFCKKHLFEFGKDATSVESQELQRKTILFMRLHLLEPFLFGKPYSSKVMQRLAKTIRPFPEEGYYDRNKFIPGIREAFILFDSVTLYTLCFLSKICCSAGLFMESRENLKVENGPQSFLQRVINATKLTPEEINLFFQCIKKNFEYKNGEFVKEANLMALLFVRELRSFKLTTALQQLDKDLSEKADCSDKWKKIGNEEYSLERYQESIAAYTSALDLNPYSYVIFSNRAQAYLRLNRFEEAELDSRASILINPSWCKGYSRLVSSLLNQNLLTEACFVADYGHEHCKDSPADALETLKNLAKESKQKLKGIGKSQLNSVNKSTTKKAVPRTKGKISEDNDDIPDLTDSSSGEWSDCEPVEKIENFQHQNLKLSENIKNEEVLPSVRVPCNVKIDRVPSASLVTTPAKVQTTTTHFTEVKQNTVSSSKIPDSSKDVKIDKDLIEKKQNELCIILREGSTLMAEGCGHLAMSRYFTVLNEVKKSPALYRYEEQDVVQLKYVYGSACIKSGTFEDLQKSISILKEIIEEHSDITFPSAYYGLGLAYCKMNRYKEATNYLEKVYSFLQKGIHFKACNWPGSISVIEETKPSNLKLLTEELLSKCTSPPTPDAICRFESCSFNPPIYYTDPDFKGFISIFCSEQCMLRYHPACWKVLKSTKHLSDKEYLDQSCLTPDCVGTVIKVECIGKDGNVEKIFISEEFDKNKKAPKQKKSKLEKKLEIKEQRKQKRHNSLTVSSTKSDTPEPTSESVTDETGVEVVAESEISEPLDDTPKENQSAVSSNGLSVNAEPFIVLKKDNSEKEENIHKASKQKDRKKGTKKTKLSIEEFCGDNFSYYNEYQTRLNKLQESKRSAEGDQHDWTEFCQTEVIPDLDPSRPYHIPESLRNDPYTLEAVLQAADVRTEDKEAKTVKETIYGFLEDVLSYKGPLSINDPELVQELENFPVEARTVINENGGFKNFMSKSMRFAIVKDYVCVIDDVIKAYDLSSKNQTQLPGSAGDELDYFVNDIVATENGFEEQNNSFSYLNPDAIEYRPMSHQSSPTENETNLESSDCESESLLSVVNQLRQPIGQESIMDQIRADLNKLVGSSYPEVSSHPEKSSAQMTRTSMTPNVDSSLSSPGGFTHLEVAGKLSSMGKWLYSDNVTEESRRQVSSAIKPYALIKVPQKANKCVQGVVPQIEMISVEVMKEDDEKKEIVELNQMLESEVSDLTQEKRHLEEKLTSALDAVTQTNKKFTLEISTIKKELEEVQFELKNKKEELHTKQTQSESEVKHLQQTLNKSYEEMKLYKSDIEKLKTETIKQEEQIKELESNLSIVTVEKDSLSKYNESQEAKSEEALELAKNQLISMEARARAAEIGMLSIKRNEFLKRIEDKKCDAIKRIKEIQTGVSSFGSNLEPYYAASIKALLVKINEYINGLIQTQNEFKASIDEQIQEVQNGAGLQDLKPLKIGILPDVPSFSNDPSLSVNLPSQAQMASAASNRIPPLPNQMMNMYPQFVPPNNMNTFPIPNTKMNFPPGANIVASVAPNPNFSSVLPMTGRNQPIMPSNIPYTTGFPSTNFSNVNTNITNASAGQQQTVPVPPRASPVDSEQRLRSTVLPSSSERPSSTPTVQSIKKESPTLFSSHATAVDSGSSSKSLNETLNTTVAKSTNAATLELGYTVSNTTVSNTTVSNTTASNTTASNTTASNTTASNTTASNTTASNTTASNTTTSNTTASNTTASTTVSNTVSYTTLRENIEKNSEKSGSQQSLSSQKTETKNSYQKLLFKLNRRHPTLSSSKLMEYVTEFRKIHNNKLSGLSMDNIVNKIGEMITNENRSKRPTVLVNKNLVSTPIVEVKPQQPQESPWGASKPSTGNRWSGDSEDNCCSICLEDMSYNYYKVDCGHRFHYKCIKGWLDKNSNCPTCRVHVLLPDDYPKLS